MSSEAVGIRAPAAGVSHRRVGIELWSSAREYMQPLTPLSSLTSFLAATWAQKVEDYLLYCSSGRSDLTPVKLVS